MQCRRLCRLLPSVARDHVRGVAPRKVQKRGMQFLPSCKTRAGRTFASFGASSTARNAIGHFGGKSDTAARRRKVALPWGVFFPLRGWRFLPTTSQIKGKQLREIINRSVTKGMSRRHEIAQKPRKEREFIIGPFVQILDYYVLLIRQKMWRRNHLSSPQIGYEFFQDLPSK